MGLFSTGYDVTQGTIPIQQIVNPNQIRESQLSTQSGLEQQREFVNALLAGNGLSATQGNVFGQMQGLANQYQGLANGVGPNPAQTMLAQNTGRNMQQQAALMGSARGSQSNPGLMSRQAAQVGGNMQQQAVGQASTLQAQQQLGAMQALAGQQGMMGNLATLGVGQQQGALSNLANQNLTIQNMMQGVVQNQNQQRLQAQLGQGQIAQGGADNLTKVLGGLLNAGGGIGAAAVAAAHGGMITGSGSILGQHAMGKKYSAGGSVGGKARVSGDSSKNDTVPAMLSPGEIVIPRSHVGEPDKAAKFLNSLMGWNLKAA